jgi:hypothetical protein
MAPLDEARNAFHEMGMANWLERADRQLELHK